MLMEEKIKMVLLGIDMQKGLVDEDLYAFDVFTNRIFQLVDTARKTKLKSSLFSTMQG